MNTKSNCLSSVTKTWSARNDTQLECLLFRRIGNSNEHVSNNNDQVLPTGRSQTDGNS